VNGIVGIVTAVGWTVWSWIPSRWKRLFTRTSWLALGLSDTVGTRGSFCRLKWAGCDADHSPLSNADVKSE